MIKRVEGAQYQQITNLLELAWWAVGQMDAIEMSIRNILKAPLSDETACIGEALVSGDSADELLAKLGITRVTSERKQRNHARSDVGNRH